MYAIIRTGGHQEKVSPGELITVDRLKDAEGDQVSFVPLAVSKDDGTVITDKKALAASSKVVATVREHLKGDKVDIYQYRQKTGYRRHVGHRQPLTLLEISEIQVDGEVFRAPEPAEETAPAEEEAEAGSAAPPKAKAKAKAGPKKAGGAKKSPAKGGAKAAKPKAEA